MPAHTIHFLRSIDPASLGSLQNVVLSALRDGATELHVHLSSDGGTNDQGFAIYHFLRSLSVPITMHCIGTVESMAVIMYLAGETRLIVPHGKIKIHPMHWSFSSGTIDHGRLSEYVDSLDFDAKRYAEIFDERTNPATERIDVRAHLAGKAILLDAKSACEVGIASSVMDAQIPAEAIRWWV